MLRARRRDPTSPPGLGRGFHLLLSAAVVSDIGDGLGFTAFPLLAARLTPDPLLISLVTAAGTLPFAVVGLFTGVLVDRRDRRRLMWGTDALRTVLVVGLVVAVVTGSIGVWGLAAFSAGIGIGTAVFNTASQAVVPALVGKDRVALGRANSRLFGAEVFGVQLAGPAVGGVLFAASRSLPFAFDAVSFAASAALIVAVPGRYRSPAAGEVGPSILGQVREGVIWLAGHRFLRAYGLTVAAFNLVVAAEEAVLVVLAERRLHLGSTGFGLLFASLAVGGFLATMVSGRLSTRFHVATLLRSSLIMLPVGAVLTGAAPDPVVCGVGLAATSFGVMLVNVAAGPLRQTLVPDALLGRVFSASTILGRTALPVGAVVGGLLARQVDPRAPYLIGAAFLAGAGLLALPAMSRTTIDGARRDAGLLDADPGAAPAAEGPSRAASPGEESRPGPVPPGGGCPAP